ncbi:MAG: multiheme c-type cytochrome [Pirellula sp.]
MAVFQVFPPFERLSTMSTPDSPSQPQGQNAASASDKFADILQKTPSKPKLSVTPRTRRILYVVLALFSLLLANGLYLSGVTFSEWYFQRNFQDLFYQRMFLVHLVLGLAFILPFLAFGFYHWRASYQRRNRRAVRIGYALLIAGLVVLVSGVLLIKLGSFEFMRHENGKRVVYWAHVLAPLFAMWLYWLHRLVGPRIKWVIAQRVGLATAVAVGAMLVVQTQDPRKWTKRAPSDGQRYFENSLASTRDGNFIPQRVLMNDDYCKKCHADVYNDWFHSAHHFSSFNNPAYLYAVRETRKVSMERDGNVHAARFCAGCHDPVPFFSGAFDNPEYDDVHDPTSQAGITCTVCHAITEVESNRGNADYIIEEPQHYPFAYSQNPILQQINQLLVKAKPAFHKSEMLKPVHKTAEFCGTCHKVHLPYNLTHYKEWVRGQNHYDSYLLSGVAGHGARSFYYPEKAQTNCNGCHMPYRESNDFAAKPHPETNKNVVHNHFFPGANTALPFWRNDPDKVELARSILKDCARVDIFGIRKDGRLDGELIAPLRPEVPAVEAGQAYLIEAVIRTLKVGHHLTQGTVDSNELWLEVQATSGDRVIGVSGGRTEDGAVDEWSHFVNNFVIDRNGDRIARRNAQDIFIALYDHQIPPGAGQSAHYRLEIPEDIDAPLHVSVKLHYRKFDKGYIDFMNREFKPGDRDFHLRGQALNALPITTIAEDHMVFPVVTRGGVRIEPNAESKKPIEPTWQRWNDYGIGLLLTGTAQLKQAAAAFSEVEKLNRFDGPLNIARVLFAEGNLDGATAAIARSATMDPAPPKWTLAWLSGEIARQQGQFEEAEQNFRSVLEDDNTERRKRNFDFSLDYVVRNQLGATYLDLALAAESREDLELKKQYLERARNEFEQVLKTDSENLMAHANLATVFERLGDSDKAQWHRQENLKYKPDDNASNLARKPARQKYPAANRAAEAVVIYSLQRPGAPGLPAESAREFNTEVASQRPSDAPPAEATISIGSP